MRIHNSSFVALAVMCAVLCACGESGKIPEAEVARVRVVAAKADGGSGSRWFVGKTKPGAEADLAFRVAGRIDRMLVKSGDAVRCGQVVAVMDDRDYRVALDAAQAERDLVEADAKRVLALFEEGNVTASARDKAWYGLQQIEQKLAHHKNQLEDTRLRSTMDGFVQSVYHEAGETVGAGMPVLQVFDNSRPEVEIKVSAADYASLPAHTPAFFVRIGAGDERPLVLDRVDRAANASGLYTMRLRFATAEAAQGVTPGMSVRVGTRPDTSLQMGDKHPARGLTVPTSALLHEEGHTCVFVYQSDKKTVSKREVDVDGVDPNGNARISSGLQLGDEVVAAGVRLLKDGDHVELMPEPSPSNVGGLY